MKVAIVGAGLMGRLTALKLIPHGHDITLLEANSFDHPHNAAAISAGLVSPLSEALFTPAETVALGFQSYQQWPQLLNLVTEIDPQHQTIDFIANGSLAVSFPEEQECLLALRKNLLQQLGEYKNDMQMLYNHEVTEIETGLERFETALYLKHEANICNAEFISASSRAIRQHASIVDHWPLKGNGQELKSQYDWVVDCRGAGAVTAQSYADNQQHPLQALRGEVIRVRAPKVEISHPVRVIQQRLNVFIAPKPNKVYVVGATEFNKHSSRSVTVRSSLDLLTTLYALHPGFADAEIIEATVGQRAIYKNQQPSISQHENIISVNGLSRRGWLVGPAMAEQIVGLMHYGQH